MEQKFIAGTFLLFPAVSYVQDSSSVFRLDRQNDKEEQKPETSGRVRV